MFKQRVLTALVLVPLVLLALYEAPAWLLACVVVMLLVLCGIEWVKLIPILRLDYQISYLLGLLFCVWLISHGFSLWLGVGLCAWFGVLLAVMIYPNYQTIWGTPFVVGAAGFLFLSLFFNAFISIYQRFDGQHLILYCFALIWAADTGAYFVGRQWGRLKLIPNVSPGKTLEGSLGGLLVALLVAIAGYCLFEPRNGVGWFIVALSVALISILGDLFISLLKRRANVKDSGHLLPGHGGILDRLDSAIAAFPLFYVGLSFLELGH